MKKSKHITAEEEKNLLRVAKGADLTIKKKAIRLLIYHNSNLVKYIITRYFSSSKIAYEDLFDEGVRSILKAIEKFDLKSKNRFAVYAGCWMKQYMRSYVEKTQLVKPGAMDSKEVIYYDDSTYQSSDDKSSTSLLDSLSSDSHEIDQEEIRQYDIAKLSNELIDSLINRSTILFIRLYYWIVPTSLLNLYHMFTNEEKRILINSFTGVEEDQVVPSSPKRKEKDQVVPELKDVDPKIETILLKYSIDSKQINSINRVFPWKTKKINLSLKELIKQYLILFSSKNRYKLSEIAKIVGKSENYLRKMNQETLVKLQQMAREKNIEHIFAPAGI